MKHQQYIIVEHRQPEQVKALRREIEDLKGQVKKLQADHQSLLVKYGGMLYLNFELIDLMRQHDVPAYLLRQLEKRVKRLYADL